MMPVAAAAPLFLSSSATAGTPPKPFETHCPAAATLVAIAQLDPYYQGTLRATVDLNGNGMVCAQQLPDAAATALAITPPGFPLYHFSDDFVSR
jgi:hypothetical protein